MEKHKLILSFDIQDENGESLIKEDFANAYAVAITEEETKEFCFTLARIILERQINHLYTECLSFHWAKYGDSNRQIKEGSFVQKWQQTPSVHLDYLHSAVKVKGKGNPYNYLSDDTKLLNISSPVPSSD